MYWISLVVKSGLSLSNKPINPATIADPDPIGLCVSSTQSSGLFIPIVGEPGKFFLNPFEFGEPPAGALTNIDEPCELQCDLPPFGVVSATVMMFGSLVSGKKFVSAPLIESDPVDEMKIGNFSEVLKNSFISLLINGGGK